MGVDAIIWFRSKDGLVPSEVTLPDGYSYKNRGGGLYEVDSLARYYGPGYERGPWHHLSAILMGLLASPNVIDVSYDPDSQFFADMRSIVGPGDIEELNRYYMSHGHRGYFKNRYSEGSLPTETEEER